MDTAFRSQRYTNNETELLSAGNYFSNEHRIVWQRLISGRLATFSFRSTNTRIWGFVHRQPHSAAPPPRVRDHFNRAVDNISRVDFRRPAAVNSAELMLRRIASRVEPGTVVPRYLLAPYLTSDLQARPAERYVATER